MLEDGLQPVGRTVERRLRSQIKCNDDGVGILVELVGHRAKPLLAGRIPQLHLKFNTVLSRMVAFDVVEANRTNVVLVELASVKVIKERCLTDFLVANNHNINFLFHFYNY